MIKLLRNRFATSALAFSALVASSCSDFLDINDDPNNPTDADISLLMPAAQVAIFGAIDNTSGGLSSHLQTVMHQYVQRGLLNDYGLQGTDFAITIGWNQFYAEALTDLNIIIEKGTESESWHAVGAAQVLKAYTYSVLADLWGEAPFSQSNLGVANPYPVYDDASDIYEQLFPLLDEAIANFAKPSSPVQGDVVYQGDEDKWRKLAKTLKLKLYNQIRLVQNVSAEASALVAEGDLILDVDDDFELEFGTSISPENRNPGFVQEWAAGGQFYYISPYFYEIMRGTNTFFPTNVFSGIRDPRIPYYFFNQLPDGATDEDAENDCAYCPSQTGTSFLSIYAYSFNIDPNEGNDQGSSQTVAGLYPLGGRYDDGEGGISSNAATLAAGQVTGPGDTPQRILTAFQTHFIIAELMHAGVVPGDARAYLATAIDKSFGKVNEIASNAGVTTISQEDIDEYRGDILALYDAGSSARQLEIIMTQKWIASFGYGVDSYNDYRRTGYPVLHDGNTDSETVTIRTRDFPVSFPHDISDLVVNPNAPGQRVIALDRVFWDPN